jgi:Uma2 family endonuclease
MSAGTEEFWVVDPSERTVQVTSRNGVHTYSSGDAIPLPLFDETTLAVEQIFA